MRRFLPHLLIFAMVALGHASGLLTALEFALADLSFRLATRPASGRIVVVEIDRDSLERLDDWPWPRRYHAAVIDRLVAAGARNIALDIDFSSRSNPGDDGALADAIARADGRVVLPVFKQLVEGNRREPAVVFATPFAPFAAKSRLGSVNIRLEEDGRARRYPAADDWQGETMTSMAVVLAAREPTRWRDFTIDYGIRPETIPRLSYTDVLTGDIPGNAIAGRSVIVGATAAELGDQLAVPVYGNLPGPVVQAMAFESLVQGRAIHRTGLLAALGGALLLAVLLGPLYERRPGRTGFAVMAGVTASGVLAPAAVLHAFPTMLDTGPCIAVTLISYLRGLWLANRARAVTVFRQQFGPPRRAMLMESVVENSADGIIIANQDGLVEFLNPAAVRLLDLSPEGALGRPMRDLLPVPSEPGRLLPWHGEAAAQTDVLPGGGDLTIMTETGARRTLEVQVRSSAVAPDGKSGSTRGSSERIFIVTVRDTSSRDSREAELWPARPALRRRTA